VSVEQGLLDTNVFIATETGRELDTSLLPHDAKVSVITAGELHLGVLAAPDTESRALRLRTVESLAALTMLPVTEDAARHWARLCFRLIEKGRRINVNDLWIASIALANDLPVVTQDNDFDALEGLGGPEIIHL
jgi:predicted nucleic acid-binding protein